MHTRLMTLLAPDGAVKALVIAKIPNLMALFVFGSQVSGMSQPESDLDLSVLAPG
jgi:predicted nucleotidyltransferase